VNTNAEPGTGNQEHPIGIFDSGVGGLSVLLEVRRELPHEDLLYVADSGHAPYGEKPVDFIERRATGIVNFFITQGAKAVVVACNTATGTAIESLRARWPLPIVGIEPAIKPAVAITKSNVVGVLATSQTIASARFARLADTFGSGIHIVAQPCPGLVEQIEKGDLSGDDTRALIEQYVRPLVEQGADTLVLGCTHYPFVREMIAAVAGPSVTIIDPAPAVAREVRRRLEQRGMLAQATDRGAARFWTSGEPAQLERMLELLGVRALLPEVFDLKLPDVAVVRVERFGEDM
jgi:glutamate racemase